MWILPFLLQYVLDEDVRQAMMKMSHVFLRLCAREIRVADRNADIIDVVEALYLLENVFSWK
jgi:hypothetical protein